jgi:pyruvate/2-oxoglutarate/acetoin dehydrogenase E1 component
VLRALLTQDSPVLLIEHKLLYPLHLMLPSGGRIEGDIAEEHFSADGLPTVSIRPVPREDCSFTVLAYGYPAELARRVLSRLAVEEEIFGELVVVSQISALDWEPIEASVSVTRRLLVIEEGVEGLTWGSEVAARISSRFFGELRRPVATAASDPTVIPTSKVLEAEMLMTSERVERAIRQVAA